MADVNEKFVLARKIRPVTSHWASEVKSKSQALLVPCNRMGVSRSYIVNGTEVKETCCFGLFLTDDEGDDDDEGEEDDEDEDGEGADTLFCIVTTGTPKLYDSC